MLETKERLKESTLTAVQELIETNLDSVNQLRKAAEAVEHNTLPMLFKRIAEERSAHASELQGFVRRNQEEPEEKGTFGGSVRGKWIDWRSAINGGDAKVVLIEAERAEDVIKGKYEKLIKETAGSAMNDVLMRQYAEVKRHHDLIRDLRDAR